MNGWLIIDKPVGIGSTQVVGAVKRALREGGYPRVKVGHGGTLDPLASGVLPVALGEATKLAGRMLDSDKVYEFTIRFGEQTDTLDAEGQVIATSDVLPDAAALEAILPRFTGAIAQVPPAYSALKVDGQRAYDLARAGQEVALASRDVVIHALRIAHTCEEVSPVARDARQEDAGEAPLPPGGHAFVAFGDSACGEGGAEPAGPGNTSLPFEPSAFITRGERARGAGGERTAGVGETSSSRGPHLFLTPDKSTYDSDGTDAEELDEASFSLESRASVTPGDGAIRMEAPVPPEPRAFVASLQNAQGGSVVGMAESGEKPPALGPHASVMSPDNVRHVDRTRTGEAEEVSSPSEQNAFTTSGGSTRGADTARVAGPGAALSLPQHRPVVMPADDGAGVGIARTGGAGDTASPSFRDGHPTRSAEVRCGDRGQGISEVTLVAHVSKGTYIRSLARDIARALCSVGYVTHLRRIKAGPFGLDRAISLDILAEAAKARGLEHHLLPLRAGLDDIPALSLTPDQAGALRQGRVLAGIAADDGQYFALSGDLPVALVEVSDREVRVVRGFNL